MTREYAIEKIISYTNEKKNFFISTTGMTSRELYELRIKKNQKNHNDFLTVGAMGHANQIAAGIAFNKKNKRIICLDGDGSVLMHMGSLAISSNFENLKHIILNNCAHDSVGGQPTISGKINFINLGKELGYKNTTLINSPKDFTTKKFANKIKKKGSSLIVIMCKKGYRKNLGRPTNIKILKNNFMKELKK